MNEEINKPTHIFMCPKCNSILISDEVSCTSCKTAEAWFKSIRKNAPSDHWVDDYIKIIRWGWLISIKPDYLYRICEGVITDA